MSWPEAFVGAAKALGSSAFGIAFLLFVYKAFLHESKKKGDDA